MAKASTSWKPGQSGNPKGAPRRDWTWSGVLENAMEEVRDTKDGKKVKVKELVVISLLNQVISGNILAIKELMNRMDGMPVQSTELTGKDGQPINTLHVYLPERAKEGDK